MSYAEEYIKSNKVIKEVSEKKETLWINDRLLKFDIIDALCQLVVSDDDILDAENRLKKFAPFIEKCFEETKKNNGIIESPIVEIPAMKKSLEETYKCTINGRLFLKMDSHLDIAGSIKARGGIYEVLKHSENLALKNSMIKKDDDYSKFAEMKDFFNNYTVQVGSTGNLGMSIGIMSAAIGFKVKVHMSADAKEWKKELLRNRGVEVLEYKDDYSKAVAEGRRLSDSDPNSYFVDDEKSVDLFLGYAVAAGRLKKQLEDMNITIDEKHQMIVYIPAGVGGAPGGVSYGLKRIFKDNVHCFFTEPVNCPSVLLGIATQKFEKANVHDFGISGITEADGLACVSPSGFVTRIMTNIISGDFTVYDYKLYDYLRLLNYSENIQIEPSSCAAFAGAVGFDIFDDAKDYCKKYNLTEDILHNSIHICWATGGRLIPEDIKKKYLETYLN